MSIFKNFRNYGKAIGSGFRNNTFTKRFDQPTYLTFRLSFGEGRDMMYNGAAGVYNHVNYDNMPHPLFGMEGSRGVENRETYSSIDYLLDANESKRAYMLLDWIEKWNDLQNNHQWYFQKIEGVEDLLKIDLTKGQRVTSDKRLTITALEGIDWRITHLLNLYRKIAWDDTYQRWVLPDMMRYFTLKIYITEFRTFHKPYNMAPNGDPENLVNTGNELLLTVLDDLLPTRVINCEMCEFDLENISTGALESLGVDEDPENVGVKFGIKVGKIYEEQNYPIFFNAYMYDKILNGIDRSKEWVQDPDGDGTLNSKYKAGLIYGNLNMDYIYTAHNSGLPFNDMANSKDMFGYPKPPARQGDKSWVSNAINWSGNWLQNEGEEIIDKVKITPIPGLGFSPTEAISAIESGNIITGFGLIRKSIDQVANDKIEASERLDGDINSATDILFRNAVQAIANTQSATSGGNKMMIEAANVVLNDDGIWEKIKDYSLATDLVGDGETNIYNPVEGGTLAEDIVNELTGGDYSKATNLVGDGETNVPNPIIISNTIIEAPSSSTATTNKLIIG